MAYQPLNIFNKDPSLAITLYTAPLNNQKKIFKEPVDIFAHWAICIRGICYELRRGIKENNEPKYVYKPIAEQDWIKMKIDQKRYPRPAYPGHMCRPYSSETINEVAQQVWDKSLQKKYVYDEHNCQVFIRLLIELIADSDTKKNFPQFFDKWVKVAGISRDVSAWTIAAGGSAMAASLAFAPVDVTGTAAAGFAMSASLVLRSSTALLNDRHRKEKMIEKGQNEIRENLRLRGIMLG